MWTDYDYIFEEENHRKTIRNSLIFCLLGLLFWPFFIVSLCIISPLKEKYILKNRRYCHISTLYWFNLIGLLLGIIATFVVVLWLLCTYHFNCGSANGAVM